MFNKIRSWNIAKPSQDLRKWSLMSHPKLNQTPEFLAAATVQRRFLPDNAPMIPHFDIAAINLPAMRITGDLYDFIPLEINLMGIAIADICGKGVEAALLMIATRIYLRTHAKKLASVEGVVSHVNQALCEDLETCRFVTLVYGVLDPYNQTYTYTNAGHVPPLFYQSRTGIVRPLSTGGVVAGLLPDASYESECLQLETDDVIVFYTDGITEATNSKGELWGETRMCQLLKQYAPLTAQGLINRILSEVQMFATRDFPQDDTTLVVLKVKENQNQ